MAQKICIWVLILFPLIKVTINITVEAVKEKSDGKAIAGSIFASAITYVIFYYAGIFELI